LLCQCERTPGDGGWWCSCEDQNWCTSLERKGKSLQLFFCFFLLLRSLESLSTFRGHYFLTILFSTVVVLVTLMMDQILWFSIIFIILNMMELEEACELALHLCLKRWSGFAPRDVFLWGSHPLRIWSVSSLSEVLLNPGVWLMFMVQLKEVCMQRVRQERYQLLWKIRNGGQPPSMSTVHNSKVLSWCLSPSFHSFTLTFISVLGQRLPTVHQEQIDSLVPDFSVCLGCHRKL